MPNPEDLRRQIGALERLDALVGTMKALAGGGMRRHSLLRGSAISYRNAVQLALQAWLQHQRCAEPERRPGWLNEALSAGDGSGRTGAPVAVIVLGSDRGLCGSFNARLVDHWQRFSDTLQLGQLLHLGVVGLRCGALLRRHGAQVDFNIRQTQGPDAITALTQRLLLLSAPWRLELPQPEQLLLLHHRPQGRGRSEPLLTPLHPLAAERIRRLWNSPWPSNARPMLYGDRSSLLEVISREWMVATISLAIVDSLTCEHMARLQAMHTAETNVQERLEALRGVYRRVRQGTITTELLDIVAGFEALQHPSL